MNILKSPKRNLFISLLAASVFLVIIFILFLTPPKAQTSYSESYAIVALEGRVSLSKNDLWPNKTVVTHKTEYRPTANAFVADTYCVNYFADESYSYEYIGRSKVPEYNVTCG